MAGLREALTADPHAEYAHWLDRTHLRYDRAAWQRGRLVAVRNSVRRGPGGWYRVEAVDYSDILDREVQQLGEDVPAFMHGLSRSTAHSHRLGELGAEAKRLALERRDVRTRLR